MPEQALTIYTIVLLIIIFILFILPGIITIIAAGQLSESIRSYSIVMITIGLLVLVTLPFDFFMNIFLAQTMSPSDLGQFMIYKTYVFRALHYLALLSISFGFLFLSLEIKKLKNGQEKSW